MYEDNLSALHAFSQGVAQTAHNIANMNTDGYTAQSFTYGAGPTGSVTPNGASLGTVEFQPSQSAPLVPAGDSVTLFSPSPYVADSMGWNMAPVYSNVEVTREMVNLIQAQNGFEANAVTIVQRAQTEHDALLGLFADSKV